MSNERVCLSTLRGISAQASAILDRYSCEQSIWVSGAAFKQFIHTLHWGNFAELDLHLLDGLEPRDRETLIDELRAYNAYLHRQRERVNTFHRAYRRWLDERNKELPTPYRERLRRWQQDYGSYDYFRITGLGIKSGIQRFLAHPEDCMRTFEQAFAELEEQRLREHRQHEQAETDWWTNRGNFHDNGQEPSQLEEALHLLGLSTNATFAEIQRAYRACAKDAHPDRRGAASTAHMVALNRAYTLLRKYYHPPVPEPRRPKT